MKFQIPLIVFLLNAILTSVLFFFASAPGSKRYFICMSWGVTGVLVALCHFTGHLKVGLL
ncbi:MAG: hypothetical protein V4481_04705 [Patescibacteria group bacterium]